MQRQHILDTIGNTPLVELRRIVPPGSARIVAKLESANPAGSRRTGWRLCAVRRRTHACPLAPRLGIVA